jgi:hypothetical protein
MSERTTVRLPTELLSRAKRKAAAQGRTLTSLIEDGLRLVVADTGKHWPDRVTPRISKARGGPTPGVGLGDLASFQEMGDQAYGRRTGRIK